MKSLAGCLTRAASSCSCWGLDQASSSAAGGGEAAAAKATFAGFARASLAAASLTMSRKRCLHSSGVRSLSNWASPGLRSLARDVLKRSATAPQLTFAPPLLKSRALASVSGAGAPIFRADRRSAAVSTSLQAFSRAFFAAAAAAAARRASRAQ